MENQIFQFDIENHTPEQALDLLCRLVMQTPSPQNASLQSAAELINAVNAARATLQFTINTKKEKE